MRNFHIKLLVFIGLFTAITLLLPADTLAQCPMCKMSAESNLKNGGTMGRGLNAGILYMFLMPYLLVGSFGVWWYMNRKKNNNI